MRYRIEWRLTADKFADLLLLWRGALAGTAVLRRTGIEELLLAHLHRYLDFL